MLVKETRTVEREIHVAPCFKCGSIDVLLSDSNYSSFNIGGGKCQSCSHEVTASVGIFPSMEELAAVWNAANDIPALILIEEEKIAKAMENLAALKTRSAVRNR